MFEAPLRTTSLSRPSRLATHLALNNSLREINVANVSDLAGANVGDYLENTFSGLDSRKP